MIFAHVMGLPVEESALALAPAGAAILSGAAVIARSKLAEIVGRLRPHCDFLEFFFAKVFTEPHSTKQIEDCGGAAVALEGSGHCPHARDPVRGDLRELGAHLERSDRVPGPVDHEHRAGDAAAQACELRRVVQPAAEVSERERLRRRLQTPADPIGEET